jgi:hypothetical protein
MIIAPIIIFAYNRPEKTERLIQSLSRAKLAGISNLFVFIDGPKNDRDASLQAEIEIRIQKYVGRFSSVQLDHRDENIGLSKSVISGVTSVLEMYDEVIVLEDDLVVQGQFLVFMNKCLSQYKNSSEVVSVNAYGLDIPKKTIYADSSVYFTNRNFSWGWAIWRDRWHKIDWELCNWSEVKKNRYAFNRYSGDDCFPMLNRWHKGLNDSWAIRFCYHQFINNQISVAPFKSLIINDGFDDSGENCRGWSRFKSSVGSVQEDIVLPTIPLRDSGTIYELNKYHKIIRRITVRLRWMFQ